MLRRIRDFWEAVTSSLWFLPALLTAAAGVVAWLLMRVDRQLAGSDVGPLLWSYAGDSASARALLGTIAGSMISVAGVAFSVTMVALTLVSNQFAPRVLRNFMEDRVNQVVLGVFVATFTYCILVLRSIGEDWQEQPGLPVVFAFLMGVAALGFFLYFIHHVAQSIQVSNIAAAVAHETHASLERMLAESPAVIASAGVGTLALEPPDGCHPVLSSREGYLLRVDVPTLIQAAAARDQVLHLAVAPGEFVVRGTPIAFSGCAPGDEALVREVCDACTFGPQRTIHQDPAFGFRQLVDIALKAVSPGINDPTTACNCVAYLGSFLVHLADREWPDTRFRDDRGELRVVLPGSEYRDYVRLACTEIRRYAREDLAVGLALLDALSRAARATTRPERLATLREEAELVYRGMQTAAPDDPDLEHARCRLASFRTAAH